MRIKELSVILISLFFITASLSPRYSSLDEDIGLEDISGDISPATDHPPIRINDDSDLAAESSSGNGTETEPYIIEGYDIDGGGSGYCLYIGNTTDYFIVRNCNLHNASGKEWEPFFSESGISFNNVSEGTGAIVNCTIESNEGYGIYIYSSNRNNIKNNTVSSNGGYGVYLDTSSGWNQITDNLLSSNSIGIESRDSDDLNISNNDITNNTDDGICFINSNHNDITDNSITNNYRGIFFHEMSSLNNVSDNLIKNNTQGISVDSLSDDNLFIHNDLIDNTGHAVDNGTNQWDDGYPSGGNYWSDYNGDDNYSGPNQDQPGGDGIGDSTYGIPAAANEDRYPLIVPTYLDTTFVMDLPRYPKTDGWLFISIPIVPYEDDVELCFSSIQESFDKLMYFDSQDSEWKTYHNGRPSHYNDPIDVGPKKGFWIHMTAEDTLNIDGYIRHNHTITLESGWNMVGYPSRDDAYACDILPTNVTKVGYFYKDSPYNIKYTGYICSVKLVTGFGYWVYNNADHPVSYTVEY